MAKKKTGPVDASKAPKAGENKSGPKTGKEVKSSTKPVKK